MKQERTVYLMRAEASNRPVIFERQLKRNDRQRFGAEREGGYTDPALWPQALMWALFREGFDVECYRGVVGPVGGDLYDDPI